MKRKLLSFMLVLCFLNQARGQAPTELGTSMANFLKIGVGARATGMGDAFVALSNDLSCLHWNPGGLGTLESNQVMFYTSSWLVDTRLNFLAGSVNLGDIGTLGLFVNSFSSGDILETTVEQPYGTGRYFTTSDLAAGITYSRKISSSFTAGLTVKFIYESIDRTSGSTFAVDLGSVFVTDFLNDMRIGFSFSNLGGRMQLDGTDLSIQYLKEPGFKYTRAQLGTEPWEIPLSFRFGIATNVLQSSELVLTIASDVVDTRDHIYQINLGTECTLLDIVSVRGGYKFSYDELDYTFGLGLKTPEGMSVGGRIDYAYSNFKIFNSIHRISIILSY